MLVDATSHIGDDLMYPFVLLGNYLKKQGHKIKTIDLDDISKFDVIIFVEFPGLKNKYFKKLTETDKKLYLIALESPIIKPDNYDKKNHIYFKKVFTWYDNLIDSKKYFKINYSHKLSYEPNYSLDKKLCSMISANKSSSHPSELYTERIKAIRWFEKEHPKDFDLYGIGWDRHYFQGRFLGINLLRLNRLKLLAKLLKSNYPSYKGRVGSKRETFKNYKFAICYENIKDFPGYISEKIFDCFLSGCIPIYLGASNITKHIPANSFIDKKKFKSYNELYKYTKNMPDREYINYLKNIKDFIQSDKAYPFSAEYFAETISREINK